jgi:DNA polymerase-3 subunit alpha
MPPDINMSYSEFTISDGTIVFGLAGVKGLGEKVCNNIVEKRPREGFNSIARLVSKKIGKGAISTLAMCGALEEISNGISREQIVANIEDIVKYYKKEQKIEERKIKIAARLKEIELWEKNPEGPKPRRLPGINEKQIPVFPSFEKKGISKKEKLNFERKTLGFYLSGHPMDNYPGLSQKATYTVRDVIDGKTYHKEVVTLPVVVSSLIEKRTKKGQSMAAMIAEDKSGRIEIMVFPRQWAKTKNVLEENAVYLLQCSVRMENAKDEEGTSIVSLVLNNAIKIDDQSDSMQMHVVKFKLRDGSLVEFIPQEQQNYSKWQQAIAFVKNMKRMG